MCIENDQDLSKFEPPASIRMPSNADQQEESSFEDEGVEFVRSQHSPQRRCFCRALDQKKIKWDLWIMLLATINCFQVPYNVAFTDLESTNIYADIFNLTIDLFFMLDVVINFRTSYIIESSSEEVFSLNKIAINYLKGRFWIDFLASIPFDLLTYAFPEGKGNQLTLQLIGLLKLIRVLRLSRLITYLNLKSELKMSLKLGKLIFFLILYLH